MTVQFAHEGMCGAQATVGATATPLANGTTNVDVDLTAALPSGAYEAGTYRAVVVLRCE